MVTCFVEKQNLCFVAMYFKHFWDIERVADRKSAKFQTFPSDCSYQKTASASFCFFENVRSPQRSLGGESGREPTQLPGLERGGRRHVEAKTQF